MSNWGEEFEVELQRDTRVDVRISFNFKYLVAMLDYIDEATREADDKYPKSEFKKIWISIMLMYLLCSAFTVGVAIIATGSLYIFNTVTLFNLASKWKRVKYNRLTFWLTTIAGIIVTAVGGWGLRELVLWIF